jgi:DNA-binding IclR family transcriptional regulator
MAPNRLESVLLHPVREAIVGLLREAQPRRVRDFVRALGEHRNTVEYHLNLLVRRGYAVRDGPAYRLVASLPEAKAPFARHPSAGTAYQPFPLATPANRNAPTTESP